MERTMKFRILHWVTESLAADGTSQVTAIFTSIPDLIDSGLTQELPDGHRLRVSLVKLDCVKGPLGVWTGPKFEGMEPMLEHLQSTQELTPMEFKLLQAAIEQSRQGSEVC